MSGRGAAVSFREEVLGQYSSSSDVHRAVSVEAAEAHARIYSEIVRPHLPEGQRSRWLDLGCGQGVLLRAAAGLGFQEVWGVDASAEMVALAQAAGTRVVKADVLEHLNAEGGEAWDVISAFDLLEHLERGDGLALLKSAHRRLRSGGVCLAKLPNGESPWAGGTMAGDLTHVSLYTPSSVSQLARLAGFARVSVYELAPVVHGVVSLGRSILWRGLRRLYQAASLVETGSQGCGVWTRNMLVRVER